ncbi:acid shock protein [Paenibacillus spiritus]|uniref:Acid shock protein n=1 Tax=Paenibacillus spiritus TaxID=2496557 RepID=A0A5J5GHD4_9BACL|nr:MULTISPECIES: acid shock protein [Paenibacillus]KAA9007555.1 acid shock protein [Paenibacillus spiritus]
MNKLMASVVGSVALSMSLTGAAFASDATVTADRGIAPLMSEMPHKDTHMRGQGVTDLNGNYHGTSGNNSGGRITPMSSDRTGNGMGTGTGTGTYRGMGTGTRDSITPLNTNNERGRYRAASTGNNDNNNSNWGWLGLIGLLGLAGMRSRNSGEQRR